jgi:hypothetical protein
MLRIIFLFLFIFMQLHFSVKNYGREGLLTPEVNTIYIVSNEQYIDLRELFNNLGEKAKIRRNFRFVLGSTQKGVFSSEVYNLAYDILPLISLKIMNPSVRSFVVFSRN